MDLGELMEDLLSDEAYVRGRRRYPRTVGEDEAIAMARHFHAELDRGTAVREVVAKKMGAEIACGRGCNGCCCELVLVREPEALAVARWLEEPENSAAKEAFLEAYPRWKAAVGDAPERLTELQHASDAKTYGEAHVDQWRKGILCAFNRDGMCSVYPVRPIVCRNAHAVETSERCDPKNTSGKPATRLAFQPVDDFVTLSRRVLQSAHHAVRGLKARQDALCDAVYRLLV